MKIRLNHFFSRALIITLCFSATSHLALAQEEDTAQQEQAKPKPPPPRAVPDTNKQAERLLSEELGEDAIVWLNAAGEKFISLWEPDRSGNPFGAILIVHGEGQTADWPYTIRALRQSLPDHGWSTLSISLPNPAETPPPARSPSDTTPPSKPTPPPTEPIVIERMKAAMSYLNKRGQYNIVILAHGVGASRSVQYLSQLSTSRPNNLPSGGRSRATAIIDRPIRALIMVNARNGIEGADDNLTEYLTDRSLPVMDIFFGDHVLDATEPDQRKMAAKKNRIAHYHQSKLLEPSANWQEGENRLTRRVRGFLNKYAKGVEIDG
ncbi:alpha/beta hydrolase family protein [Saccharophagus degradans]|uniref:alpha/beta hydrolase family protein n=1 Tax=Saccharophagus degradans TaxID=86304 RepID=UPI002477EFF0|nr:alpha/beta hydrolase family protein [Saccharophagus degradans]WGO97813.1 alpha/beta hydrolase family protein [Saccharophagus degradans]